MTEAGGCPNPCTVFRLSRSNFSSQDFQDPCGLQGSDTGRCCPRANARARFHAICCMLRNRVSLVCEKSRVQINQDV